MPLSLVTAACAVLEEDERLASAGASAVRARLLARTRIILKDWSLGQIDAEQAEGALRAFLAS